MIDNAAQQYRVALKTTLRKCVTGRQIEYEEGKKTLQKKQFK